MKRNNIITKCAAGLLSVALVMSLTPTLHGIGIKAYAGSGMDKPSVQAYADVTTLTDNTFAPDASGASSTIGKLKFGKNGSNAIEWYILGADEEMGDKNIVIFATDAISSKQVFQSNKASLPKWNNAAEDGDYSDYIEGHSDFVMNAGTELYYNHYGASTVRKVLQEMAVNSSYFGTAEQELLQSTKIKTSDYLNHVGTNSNGYSYYTTEDKLYLASSTTRSFPSETESLSTYNRLIYVGSESDQTGKGIKLHSGTYWNSTYYGDSYTGFWLRSPYPETDYLDLRKKDALFANRNQSCVGNSTAYDDGGVRPASNVDLSLVRFASAAPLAESSTAKGGVISTSGGKNQAAMTLRLDGSTKNIGTYVCDESSITVKKGSTTSDVSLVVQGKSGDYDWYYCKQISGDETVSAEAIAAAVNAGYGATIISAADINFDYPNCKIWLEIPADNAYTLSYAVDKGNKHEHNNTDAWDSDADGHYHKCTEENCPNNGRVDEAKHEFNADYVCTVCGYDHTSIIR